MADPKEEKNPIICYLHGVPIRATNVLSLRINESAYRDLIEQSHKTELPMSKIILMRNEPCQACGCDNASFETTLTKRKYDYRLGENGGNLVKNHNGKGQPDNRESQDTPEKP